MLGRFKALFRAQDMTEGNISRLLIKFTVPLLIGNFAQQLYSTVDAVVVSRAVPNGLAAIGASSPLLHLFVLLFIAISTGAGVMVAQYFGAKQIDQLMKTVGNTVTLVFFAGILVTVVGVPLSRPVLEMINTPPEIIDMSAGYMQVMLLGTIASGFYNIISGILRGLGDSFSPLIYLLVAAATNVVLDIWFVWGLGWGVPGAAWATIISQLISAILCLRRLYNMDDLPKLTKHDLRPHRHILTQIMKLGIPAGLQQIIFSAAMVMVQRLTNSMGTMVINANTAVIRIDGFAMMPNFTFSMATSTFIGQNIGARKMDRVIEGGHIARRLALITSIVLTVSILIAGRPMLRMFSDDPTVITVGYGMMSILAVGYIAMSQTQVYAGILRGAGDTLPSLYISIITTVFLRVPLAYLLAYLTRSPEWPNGSPYMLSVSLVATWTIGAVLNYLWYKRGNWRSKAVVDMDGEEETLGELFD